MKIGRATYVALCLLSCSIAHSSAPRFQSLAKGDGLPGDTVWAIEQDRNGYLWIGTTDGLAHFDGHRITPAHSRSAAPKRARALHVDQMGRLWVGTNKSGLIVRLKSGEFRSYSHDPEDSRSLSSNQVMAVQSDPQGHVWLGTSQGLNRLDPDTGRIERIPHDVMPQPAVRSLLRSPTGNLWVGTSNGLTLYDAANQEFTPIELGQRSQRIVSLYEDHAAMIWVGTTGGLFRYDPRSSRVDQPIKSLASKTVTAITGTDKELWVGTLRDGLYRQTSGGLSNYRYGRRALSLADNTIATLTIDRGGVLWIGTFYNGISKLDLNSLAFGLVDDSPSSASCMTSNVVYGLLTEAKSIAWIGTQQGVVRLDTATSQCQHFPSIPDQPDTLSHGLVWSFLRESDNTLWVATQRGLNLLDETSGLVDRLVGQVPKEITFFALKSAPGQLLLGTEQGLFRYTIKAGVSSRVDANDPALSETSINGYVKDQHGRIWLATDEGIAYLDSSERLTLLRKDGLSVVPHSIKSIYVDAMDRIWAGVEDQGLWIVGQSLAIKRKLYGNDGFPADRLVTGILPDRQGNVWVSTLSGIVKIDSSLRVVGHYQTGDGLQSNSFSRGAIATAASGELWFGGQRGVNAFFPTDIGVNIAQPNVAITEIRLMNKLIEPGTELDGVRLPLSIDNLEQLRLNHNHKMFSLEFAALDYADVGRNQYAYMLEGFDEDWNFVPASERRATYTNLGPGDYTFRVRGANKDGVWNETGRSLAISIAPAPWLTWWAKAIYALCVLAVLVTIVQVRSASHRRRARELEVEVNNRTREVQQQKSTIEDILARKNALFENVSHEFRTPLTLLIGPLEQLRDELNSAKQETKLDLALRNAKRLLLMVDQLLRLAEVSQDEKLEQAPRDLAPVLHMLAASFASIAQQANVNLTMGTVPDVVVLVSHDALETVVGNLLSNAIKYVGSGGNIMVRAGTNDELVQILVQDDGPGIPTDQLSGIFERFSRLTEHSDHPGTGLGLAVCKEVIEANGGSITVSSKPGAGTTFTVSLPSSQVPAASFQPLSEQVNVLTAELSQSRATSDTDDEGISNNDQSLPVILVIDDNRDILTYVRSVLEPEFNFLGASNGTEGFELSKSTVPDLIICDVMMPDIDGFEVSKLLRAEPTTCHIPIVMLTAKGDRASRLRGWEQTVDEYLHKPFDEHELRARVRNLLAIRKLLSRKLGQQFTDDGEIQTDQLSKRDQKFVDKLHQAVESHFAELSFGRTQLASLMAVSERQLQRKLKALIDQSPSDFLREFRLLKAKRLLLEGQQVTLVADACGFTSGSYFAKCFKDKFGLAPKQYQLQAQGQRG